MDCTAIVETYPKDHNSSNEDITHAAMRKYFYKLLMCKTQNLLFRTEASPVVYFLQLLVFLRLEAVGLISGVDPFLLSGNLFLHSDVLTDKY